MPGSASGPTNSGRYGGGRRFRRLRATKLPEKLTREVLAALCRLGAASLEDNALSTPAHAGT